MNSDIFPSQHRVRLGGQLLDGGTGWLEKCCQRCVGELSQCMVELAQTAVTVHCWWCE